MSEELKPNNSSNKVNLIVFIPGYTLLSSVFRNYCAHLGDWQCLSIDYFDLKSLEDIISRIHESVQSINYNKLVLVGQSVGFKIAYHYLYKNSKVSKIFGFNPLYHPPKKFAFSCKNHERLVRITKMLANSKIGQFGTKGLIGPKEVLVTRRLLGNKNYYSKRLQYCLVQLKRDRNLMYEMLVNPLNYLYSSPLEENRFNQEDITFLIGKGDTLLLKDFKGDYYQGLYGIFKNAKFHFLPGGHEGFLEEEKMWIEVFKNYVSEII
ncbi:hypothetical protein [Ulvibacterium sp.]|uniref:hypothetical protein n=1 Tax=Ulvibacterium sp. TaxID=2665914 RepID=UPI00260B5C85|nr:hypothetical protein [Ulvibacterium sp.]